MEARIRTSKNKNRSSKGTRRMKICIDGSRHIKIGISEGKKEKRMEAGMIDLPEEESLEGLEGLGPKG